jgi:GNAT superfamily N-acetyltransferase
VTTELHHDRELGLRTGYAATDWGFPISFDDYCRAVEDWEIKTIVRDGVCIGAAYRKGDEIHVSIVPEWRRKWVTKGLLRALFTGPRVTTQVAAGHDYMYDILNRLGFKPTGNGMLVKENSNGH